MMLHRLYALGLLVCSLLSGLDAGDIAAVRTRSQVEARAREVVGRYSDQRLAAYGILDPAKPPYRADPSGRADSTQALRDALADARDARLVVFLPAGRYRVSGTIECVQGTVRRDHWDYPPADPVIENESYFFPCVLTGPRSGPRATIVLAPRSPGFSNPGEPKPVVHFWARNESRHRGQKVDPSRPQPNISFNQLILDVDVEIGEGNPGAVAIHHQAAQGSAIEDVHINARGGFAGVRTAPGSGGGIHGLSVEGGRFGLFVRGDQSWRGSQPVPVVSGARLTGQTEASILYDGRGPLTVVGAEIEGSGIVVDAPPGAPWNGPLNVVDSILRIRGNSPAVASSHAVYLNNVHVKDAAVIARVKGRPDLRGRSEGWTHVVEYAASSITPYPKDLGISPQHAIWRDGRPAADPYADVRLETAPPASVVSRHVWARPFPAWNDPDIANVREKPYRAAGDGKADDAPAIQRAIDSSRAVFLPKGVYALSRPLRLKRDSRLIGISNLLSVLEPLADAPAFSDLRHPAPLVETDDSADASTVLAFVQLRVPLRRPAVYALSWRAGRNSVVRDVNPLPTQWEPDAPGAFLPMVLIHGSGGGRWYNLTEWHWWSQGPEYRHLLVDGTHEPLAMYMLNPEHAQSTAMVELRNSRNVDIYSIKAEGNYTVLWMRGCRGIRLFGYGGNGSPWRDWAMVRIDDSQDVMLANIAPQLFRGQAVGGGALGVFLGPEEWFVIRDGTRGALRGTEQVVLYKTGARKE